MVEAAEGYEELLRQGLSIEQLMEKIGKKRGVHRNVQFGAVHCG
jgi:hypothetical protein